MHDGAPRHSKVSVSKCAAFAKASTASRSSTGVDLEVERGEIFVIMGPSGSGKSVLLRHIIGLEQPDAGEILVEGQTSRPEGVMDRYRMAMVFQSGALLNSLTVGRERGPVPDRTPAQAARRDRADRRRKARPRRPQEAAGKDALPSCPAA